MPRLYYALPVDVYRRWNPQISQGNLKNWKQNQKSAPVGYEDYERMVSRLEGVESKFHTETGHALRETREGSVGSPATFEYYDNKYWQNTPATVYLNHRQIIPFDRQQGDRIEIRTARDSWRDITSAEGQRWTADYRMGKLNLYARLRRHRWVKRGLVDDRFIRVSYRYGALGGDRTEGGQTTVTESLTDSESDTGTFTVANASRLPSSGGVMLLGGEEYVRVDSVDPQAGEVSVGARGARRTSPVSHSPGTVIHYCPMSVREAVAAKAARELQLSSDWTDDLVETGGGAPAPQAKLESWEKEWKDAVSDYRSSGYM